MTAALIVAAAMFFVWLLARRPGSSFWKLAATKPDEAFEWLRARPGWVVVDPIGGAASRPSPRNAYSGPYFLWVPQLGRNVKLFALHAELEAAQDEFLRAHGIVGNQGSVLGTTSALALIYPVAGTVHFASSSGEPFSTILGYALTQLGYLLLFAGAFAGSFRVLRLTRRAQVFLAGVSAWVTGIVLSNIGA